jgi:hypothetical protein
MKTLALLLVPFALLLVSCGSASEVPIYLSFADPNPEGSSAVDPLEITTAEGAAGRVAIELRVESANGYSGPVEFRAILDEAIFDGENLAAAVIYDRTDPDSNTSDTPYELSPGEVLSFFAILDPEDGSGDCTTTTKVRISTIPPSDFVEIFLTACPPP